MIFDVFQQFYELIVSQIITIPLDNTLGVAYAVISNLALLIVQLFTGQAISLPSIF